MGFLPIFLYLAGFLLLFTLVVANNFKSKKVQYQHSMDQLVAELNMLDKSWPSKSERPSLVEVEKHYQALKLNASQESLDYLNRRVKPRLAKTKLQLYWYNKLIMKKPYSFVARIMGYRPI